MKWEQGREVIDGLLADADLERVHPSRDHADIPKVLEMIEIAEKVLDNMPVY